MYLINDIYLLFSGDRRIGNFFDNLPDVIDAVIGSGIDFDHIHISAICNGLAALTLSAGRTVLWVRTVHCLCKNFGNRRLTCSARSAEQVSMTDPTVIDLILECRDDVILPPHLIEGGGPEFTIQCYIRHGKTPKRLSVVHPRRRRLTSSFL